ncbi:MAG: rhodanese-like domain-containing protein [Proteobacteria bacterium]|nr:rhodanese-like domain-containing protein [Pseudomonadota bacterium]MCP4921054.1 rhodanese-like domain-containing protein [Pseudomonadota bacterium]
MFALLLACSTPDATPPSESGTDSELVESTPPAEPCDGITPEVTDLDSDELATMLEANDFVFIDVHVPYAGEIAGTDAHIEYTEIDALEAAIGELDARAVLYCKTGPMSERAANALIDRGYCAIYDYPAGMNGWERDGYELE